MIDIAEKVFKGFDYYRKDTSLSKSKFHFPVLPIISYSLQTGFVGGLTTNVSFTNGKDNSTKVSNVLMTLAYTQYNQVLFLIQPAIWTDGNRYNITADIDFLKYPVKSFGLGATTENDLTRIDYNYTKFHIMLVRKIVSDFSIGLGYMFDFHWNIQETRQGNDPDTTDKTDFQKYDGRPPHSLSSGATLNLLYDSRHNAINAEDGFYCNVNYRSNLTVLGSDNNWQSLLIDMRKYFRFPESTKNVLAFWSYNWLTLSGHPPFLDLPSTQWDMYGNTGRGYIQGRFRGLNMVDLETEYRFGILRNGLIGGVVFANMQSFSNYFTNGMSPLYPGYGFGLRLKIEKYSRTNVCFDYGFGAYGSQGLFLNLTEVF